MKNANPLSPRRGPRRPRLRVLAGLTLLLGLALLSGGILQGKTAAPVKGAAEFFPIAVGDKVLRLQLAVTGPEMERGLMGRRTLAADEGMVFLFPKPQRLSFWMRNTPLPLDIGYFDAAGRLREHYPLHPFDETSVASRADDLQFAVEVNQGWFRANQFKRDALLDLKALAEALRQRGFDPAAYGLKPKSSP
ncbi:MAG: DUF192 domain-containing protein [Verrucomicrobia bacterium]|nr:DUF192 domain-containing protein [Verrucomicrobiota bacterium]